MQQSNTEESYSAASIHILLYFQKKREELESNKKLCLPAGTQNVG